MLDEMKDTYVMIPSHLSKGKALKQNNMQFKGLFFIF